MVTVVTILSVALIAGCPQPVTPDPDPPTPPAAPTIVSTFPADEAVSIGTNSNLFVTFSTAVSVHSGAITIFLQSDDSVVEAIPADSVQVTLSGTDTIKIDPTADLTGSEAYYVQIAATAISEPTNVSYCAGIANKTTWNFTADVGQDVTAPTIAANFTPQDNAVDVAPGTNLEIVFDEEVVAGTGNVTIHLSSDDSVVEAIAVDSAEVTGTGSTTITANPAADLASETAYYVIVDAGAFDDRAGNPFAGVLAAGLWNFTTADVMPPEFVSSTPADGEIEWLVGDNLTITFDENVAVGTGNLTLYDASDDSVIEAFDVATATEITGWGSASLTINPVANLPWYTDIYVQIDAGAILDEATVPNAFPGISDKTTLNFQVEPRILLLEQFNYGLAGGDLETISTTWSDVGAAASSAEAQYNENAGLSFLNYPTSGAVGYVTVRNDDTGGAVERTFLDGFVTTKGVVYLAMLVTGETTSTERVPGASVLFYDSANAALGGLTLYDRDAGGVGVGNSRMYLEYISGQWLDGTNLLNGTARLVVIKYDFTNDTIAYFRDPNVSLAEPAATRTQGTIAFAQIASVAIDQAISDAAITVFSTFWIDEIKVVKDWTALAE